MIRLFTMDDYDEAHQLWAKTPGIGLRSIDDSKEIRQPERQSVLEQPGMDVTDRFELL